MEFSGLKATFDRAADQYAAVRPSYPAELVQAVIDLSGLPAAGASILEIGCGTGQATAPFAERGYSMVCLEPGPNLAAATVERFRTFPNVVVETITFEDWAMRQGAFDLVMSAQAFHWIAPEVGLPKAAEALKPTGSLALFWNLVSEEPVTDKTETGITELSEAIQSQYALHAPELIHVRRTNRLEEQVATIEAQMHARTDLVRDMRVLRFPWTERYDTARYIALLSTYSNHIALPDPDRRALFDGIARAIEEHGAGFLVKRYVSALFLARTTLGGR